MDETHRTLREALGAYVLGHLDEIEAARIGAHLDGCATCRAEYDALAPLAVALRDVDPGTLEQMVEPGALLGARIESEINADRLRRRRRTVMTRSLLGAAACVVLALTFLAGTRLAEPEAGPPVPLEAVTVVSNVDGVTARADVVDHTWGVEIKLIATGLDDGAAYTTTVQQDGREFPAGEFIGVAGVEIRCNMNASVLRDDATGFTVWDGQGNAVLTAEL